MSFNLESLDSWELEEVTEEDLERWRTAKTSARQVLITLANETDNPSVMTEIRVDVHEMVEIYDCGEAIGGSIVIGTLYDFKIPNQVPWSGTQTQNFVVNPRSVEAFATTVGPMYGDLSMRVFRSSISAQTTSDGQLELGQIVGVDVYDPDFGYAEDFIAQYRASNSYAPGVIANCASQMLEMIEGLTNQAQQSSSALAIDPTLETITAYYEGLIASEPVG